LVIYIKQHKLVIDQAKMQLTCTK